MSTITKSKFPRNDRKGAKNPMFGRKHSEESKKKMSEWIVPESTREKIGASRLANKNPMWKGDGVGNSALHLWIKRNFIKPEICECCKLVPPYDLANKGVYDRNIENWEWLCRKCHMTKDGRLENLKQFKTERK